MTVLFTSLWLSQDLTIDLDIREDEVYISNTFGYGNKMFVIQIKILKSISIVSPSILLQ